MRNTDRTLLTLEERMELAKRSQVASPETAAKLVQRFSEVHAAQVFRGHTDIDSMYELTGEFWEFPMVDVNHYRSFCHSFRLAMEYDNDNDCADPYRPVWGFRTNNAMVLLGLMLLDHAKGLVYPKDIYHCIRMTLRQYLDALVDLSFHNGGKRDQSRAEGFRIWRSVLLKDYDGSKTLEETLADILRRYIAAWQEFDHLNHIIRCMAAYACCLEQGELPQAQADRIRRFRKTLHRYDPGLDGEELEEPDKMYPDPGGYYFALASEYPDDMPDPGSRDILPGTLRSQIFLTERDYTPDTLRELAARSPSPDLGALLEKSISEEKLAFAMHEINTAVTDLFFLWVEPYLGIEQYHYEEHMDQTLHPGRGSITNQLRRNNYEKCICIHKRRTQIFNRGTH